MVAEAVPARGELQDLGVRLRPAVAAGVVGGSPGADGADAAGLVAYVGSIRFLHAWRPRILAPDQSGSHLETGRLRQ